MLGRMPYRPAEEAVGLSLDSRKATHCWNDDGAPPLAAGTVAWLPVLGGVVVPALAAGWDAAGDPSSDVAGAWAGASGAGMLVTPERPSGTFTFWPT